MLRIHAGCSYPVAGGAILFQSPQQALKLCHGSRRTMGLHEHASTFAARVVASTGADCAAALSSAVGALSGPLHGGAPSRVLKMLDEVERSGDAARWVSAALDPELRFCWWS